jgi:hypothetical protein
MTEKIVLPQDVRLRLRQGQADVGGFRFQIDAPQINEAWEQAVFEFGHGEPPHEIKRAAMYILRDILARQVQENAKIFGVRDGFWDEVFRRRRERQRLSAELYVKLVRQRRRRLH